MVLTEEKVGDSLSGCAIAEHGAAALAMGEPGFIGSGFEEEAFEVEILVASEACDARLHSFRALGVGSEHEHGFAEGGGFFLNATGVGHNHPGA